MCVCVCVCVWCGGGGGGVCVCVWCVCVCVCVLVYVCALNHHLSTTGSGSHKETWLCCNGRVQDTPGTSLL